MDRSDRARYPERVVPEAVVPLAQRSRVLDEMVREEVTGGAHVAHRDSVTAVLVRGSERALVTVDEAGNLHVDRLAGPQPRLRTFVLLTAVVATAFLLTMVLLSVSGILAA